MCSIPAKATELESWKLTFAVCKHLVLSVTKGRGLVVVGKLGIFTGTLTKVIRSKMRVGVLRWGFLGGGGEDVSHNSSWK